MTADELDQTPPLEYLLGTLLGLGLIVVAVLVAALIVKALRRAYDGVLDREDAREERKRRDGWDTPQNVRGRY